MSMKGKFFFFFLSILLSIIFINQKLYVLLALFLVLLIYCYKKFDIKYSLLMICFFVFFCFYRVNRIDESLNNQYVDSSYEIIEKSVDNTDVTEDSYTNLYTDNNEETENNQYAEKYDTNMTEDYAKLVEMSLEKMLNICAVAIYEYDKNDKYILNKKTFWSMLDYYFGMYGVTDELVDVKTAETQFGLCAGVSVDDIEKIASAYIPNFKTIPNIPIDYKMVKYSKAKDMYIFNINWDGDFFTKYKIIGYKKNEEGKIEVRIGTYDPEQISDTEFTENKVLVDASKYEANKLNEYIILLENNIFDGIDIGYSICSVNKIN